VPNLSTTHACTPAARQFTSPLSTLLQWGITAHRDKTAHRAFRWIGWLAGREGETASAPRSEKHKTPARPAVRIVLFSVKLRTTRRQRDSPFLYKSDNIIMTCSLRRRDGLSWQGHVKVGTAALGKDLLWLPPCDARVPNKRDCVPTLLTLRAASNIAFQRKNSYYSTECFGNVRNIRLARSLGARTKRHRPVGEKTRRPHDHRSK